MFNKITITFLSALSFCIAVAFYYHIHATADDETSYRNLMISMNLLRSEKALEKDPAHQVRQHVQKDVWKASNGKRSHFRLRSQGSELSIHQLGEKFEIKEDLQAIECSMQETIDYKTNSQEIRWITAREGTYFYPTHHFEVIDAELSFFSINGTNLPDTKPDTPCFIKIAAEKSIFTIKDLLRLSGNVRLFTHRLEEKESFALADELIYHPGNGTLLLLAKESNKVLFWQDDLRISAKQLQIQRDPTTKTESVKGMGDVHFSFDMEEEKTVNEIFGRWL